MAALSDLPPLAKVNDSTGNANWDRYVVDWLPALTEKFGVRPTVFFYDDGNRPNALAIPAESPNRPDGTVVLGRNLLAKYFNVTESCRLKIANHELIKEAEEKGGKNTGWKKGITTNYAEFAAWWCDQPESFFANLQPLVIIAHEFGHILQFKDGMRSDGPWQMEPHADYMSGWYVGKYVRTNAPGPTGANKGTLNDETLTVFAQTLFKFGDIMFNDKAHHGEPDYRAAMVRAGYDAADLDAKAAFEKGRSIVGLPRARRNQQ